MNNLYMRMIVGILTNRQISALCEALGQYVDNQVELEEKAGHGFSEKLLLCDEFLDAMERERERRLGFAPRSGRMPIAGAVRPVEAR